MTPKLSIAQTVRLSLAGMCQVVGIFLFLSTPIPNGKHLVYYTTENGDGYVVLGSLFLFMALLLAIASLYRFRHPVTE